MKKIIAILLVLLMVAAAVPALVSMAVCLDDCDCGCGDDLCDKCGGCLDCDCGPPCECGCECIDPGCGCECPVCWAAGDCGTDGDRCESGCTCDCHTPPLSGDYALAITEFKITSPASTAKVKTGSTITGTVTVKNIGSEAAVISGNDPAVPGEWCGGIGILDVPITSQSFSGTIAPDASITFSFSLKVGGPPADGVLDPRYLPIIVGFTHHNNTAEVSDLKDLVFDYIINNFGTFALTGKGTKAAKLDRDNTKFTKGTGTLYNDTLKKEVPAADYTVSKGSTVLTLSEKYLKSLKAGSYTFTATFDDGLKVPGITLTVTNSSSSGRDVNTGDLSMLVWFTVCGVTLATVGTVGFVAAARKKRKSR
ncbi:MAG: hypothetical protein FWE86_00380 [Oscillospiraceae bacterium]|nr:hypothetical protein [Oscillospiraceae bacterium]